MAPPGAFVTSGNQCWCRYLIPGTCVTKQNVCLDGWPWFSCCRESLQSDVDSRRRLGYRFCEHRDADDSAAYDWTSRQRVILTPPCYFALTWRIQSWLSRVCNRRLWRCSRSCHKISPRSAEWKGVGWLTHRDTWCTLSLCAILWFSHIKIPEQLQTIKNNDGYWCVYGEWAMTMFSIDVGSSLQLFLPCCDMWSQSLRWIVIFQVQSLRQLRCSVSSFWENVTLAPVWLSVQFFN